MYRPIHVAQVVQVAAVALVAEVALVAAIAQVAAIALQWRRNMFELGRALALASYKLAQCCT